MTSRHGKGSLPESNRSLGEKIESFLKRDMNSDERSDFHRMMSLGKRENLSNPSYDLVNCPRTLQRIFHDGPSMN